MTIQVTLSAEHPGDLLEQMKQLFRLYDDVDVSANVRYAVAQAEKAADTPTIDAAPAPAAAEPPKRRGRPPKAAEPIAETVVPAPVDDPARDAVIVDTPAPAISVTPENRVNPDDVAEENDAVDDGIEDMPQPGAKLTVDDLRNAAGRINRALGNNPARAQELAAPAFVQHGVKSISTCPDDKLETMIAALNAVAVKVEAGEVK